MTNAPVVSDVDMVLFAIIMIGILALTFFRLDTIFTAPKRKSVRVSAYAGTDEDGAAIYTDPDGRRWKAPKERK